MKELTDEITKKFISLMKCFDICDDIDESFNYFPETEDEVDLLEYEEYGLVCCLGRHDHWSRHHIFHLTDLGKELVNTYIVTLDKL